MSQPGSYALTPASSLSGIASPVSNSFTITAGTATQSIWHTQPGPAAAGGTLNPQPVLYLEDANGSLETADNSSTVTLSLTIPNGAALGGTNKVTVNGGIATFTNLSVNMAGSYTLTPASSLLGITSPASNSFTVTAGTATQLMWHTQPGRPLPEGKNLNPQPVLDLEDANGNLETADNSSTVTLSLTIPNGAKLGVAAIR